MHYGYSNCQDWPTVSFHQTFRVLAESSWQNGPSCLDINKQVKAKLLKFVSKMHIFV